MAKQKKTKEKVEEGEGGGRHSQNFARQQIVITRKNNLYLEAKKTAHGAALRKRKEKKALIVSKEPK